MGMFEELGKTLSPHARKLNETIAVQGQLIHNKLSRIESAVSDLGRADFGDKWFRLPLRLKPAGEEEIEIGVVPQNEVWLLQSLVNDGAFTKGPGFSLFSGGSLLAVVGKEEIANLKLGGDVVGLPGEKLVILARAAGTISGSLNLIRRLNPAPKSMDLAFAGRDNEKEQTETTHDPDRDLITSPNGQYQEKPAELNSPGLIVPSAFNE